MRRTNIYLDDEQIRELDVIADHRNSSRAEVVRDMIDRGLHGTATGWGDIQNVLRQTFGALRVDDIEVVERGATPRSRRLDGLLDR